MEKLRRENSVLKEENSKFLYSMKSGSENEIIAKIRDLEERNESLNKILIQKERDMRGEIEHKEDVVRGL